MVAGKNHRTVSGDVLPAHDMKTSVIQPVIQEYNPVNDIILK
jgi:hypothetical protein